MAAALSVRQVLVVQILVGGFALAAGGGLGWFVGRASLEREQRARLGMAPEALLERLQAAEKQYADLYAHCEPLQGSERDRLLEAQTRVDTLRSEIAAKEEEISKLERKAHENVALKAELETRRQELGRLRSALEAAEQERAELVERLELAVQEVSVARAETTAAKQETLGVQWSEFRANAALAVCEKGTRGRMEKCRETVLAALTPERERRYRECLRRGQAVPQLRALEKGEEDIPAFAEWLDRSTRSTRDWYILFCDPTLPEAGDDAPIRAAVGESDPLDATARPDAMHEALEDETTTP